jgi:NADPH2:quinone reductase
MRAVEVQEFGGPEVLRNVETDEPAAENGWLAVRVAVADTLWLETMVRSGRGGDAFPVSPPYRPGVGVAGVVEAIGSGGDPALLGRRVVARLGPAGGGYAEVAVAEVGHVITIPEGVGDRVAAALLHDGTTAVALAELVKIQAGERVLVTAAGGGLGALLVQLARAAGADVVAAARGEAKLERLRELGAEAVDYSRPEWTAGVGDVDVVLDGAGGDYGRAALGLVAPGGRFSGHGMPAGGFVVPDQDLARERSITATGIADVQLSPERFNRAAATALQLAATRTFAPLIGQTFPLEQAAEAHRAIEERRAVGKTLLTR